jgi:hypothetical protein
MLFVFDKRLPRESVSKHPPDPVNVEIEGMNGSAARPNTGGHLTEQDRVEGSAVPDIPMLVHCHVLSAELCKAL